MDQKLIENNYTGFSLVKEAFSGSKIADFEAILAF